MLERKLDKILELLMYLEDEIKIDIYSKILKDKEKFINSALEILGEDSLYITEEESDILLREYLKRNPTKNCKLVDREANIEIKLKRIIKVLEKKYNARINPAFIIYDIYENKAQEINQILKSEECLDIKITERDWQYYTQEKIAQKIKNIMNPKELVKEKDNCWTKAQIPKIVLRMTQWNEWWNTSYLLRHIIEEYQSLDLQEYVEKNQILITEEEYQIIKDFSKSFQQVMKIIKKYQKIYPYFLDMRCRVALKKMTKEERNKVCSCFQKYSPKKQGIVIYYLNKMKQVINQYKKSQKEKILAKDEKFKSRKKERGC